MGPYAPWPQQAMEVPLAAAVAAMEQDNNMGAVGEIVEREMQLSNNNDDNNQAFFNENSPLLNPFGNDYPVMYGPGQPPCPWLYQEQFDDCGNGVPVCHLDICRQKCKSHFGFSEAACYQNECYCKEADDSWTYQGQGGEIAAFYFTNEWSLWKMKG